MKCPFCGHDDTHVKDSRPAEENSIIRRRRVCSHCGARFTTSERVHLRELTVVKNDGRREPFRRDKLLQSMRTALRKRPVETDRTAQTVTSIVRQLETTGEQDIRSQKIGEMVMDALATLDLVAYVRYASVYKDFTTTADFNNFLEELKIKDDDKAS